MTPARRLSLVLAVVAAGALLVPPASAAPARPAPSRSPLAVGTGGAVTSVDPDATRIGLEVLRQGGNAADAAVATAAALGVTEPYSSGIGGGGYFVYFDAASGEVTTIDGRETAPQAMPSNAFIVPGSVSATAPYGVAYPFADLV